MAMLSEWIDFESSINNGLNKQAQRLERVVLDRNVVSVNAMVSIKQQLRVFDSIPVGFLRAYCIPSTTSWLQTRSSVARVKTSLGFRCLRCFP